jgi:hypothetical protein
MPLYRRLAIGLLTLGVQRAGLRSLGAATFSFGGFWRVRSRRTGLLSALPLLTGRGGKLSSLLGQPFLRTWAAASCRLHL